MIRIEVLDRGFVEKKSKSQPHRENKQSIVLFKPLFSLRKSLSVIVLIDNTWHVGNNRNVRKKQEYWTGELK